MVDASVAVKWFVPEKHYEEALRLRDAYLDGRVDLVSPGLVVYEVANALRFHRVYKLSLEDIVSAVKDIVDLGVVRRLTLEAWLRAVELSVNMGVSIYDAVYGAMTLILNDVLITSDKILYEK